MTQQTSDAQPWHELSAQLIELQTQLAFQEDALQALDDAVTRQQQTIDRLLLAQQRLESQLAEVLDNVDAPPADEPPPHY